MRLAVVHYSQYLAHNYMFIKGMNKRYPSLVECLSPILQVKKIGLRSSLFTMWWLLWVFSFQQFICWGELLWSVICKCAWISLLTVCGFRLEGAGERVSSWSCRLCALESIRGLIDHVKWRRGGWRGDYTGSKPLPVLRFYLPNLSSGIWPHCPVSVSTTACDAGV